ncbi:hypothetical protein EZS27_024619 [termite gut metagenome]|uniref:ATPase AAA-type core domain-containing protein n=1 Tax=termite gut metagenome TaxID=433724 RepID=A0A5J4QY85_9ZZZZ
MSAWKLLFNLSFRRTQVYRYDGNINIKKESELESDRLLSLILSLDYNNQNILTDVIDNKKVYSIDISINEEHKTTSQAYLTEKLKDFYDQMKYSRVEFKSVYKEIILQWSKLYAIDFSNNLHNDNHDDLHELALNYLVYKTLRVTWQYNEYSFFYSDLVNNNRKHPLLINELVQRIDEDKSHITLKIRQAISYLLCHHIILNEEELIKTIGERIDKALKKDLGNNILLFQKEAKMNSKNSLNLMATDGGAANNFRPTVIDMLPPPFFNIEMNLKDKEDGDNTFKFSTLSSGEKQMTYTIGTILYHLNNVDSVRERGESDDIYYKHINIILEEIELYYHPEMQRKLITHIINNIKKLNLKTKSIQILLVTHSPFVLSDIPKNNVLYLDQGRPCKENDSESFGANIFELLKDSFYLKDGPIGVHSYKILTEMFEKLNKKRLSKKEFDAVKDMTQYIGEPFLKEELEKLIELKKKDYATNKNSKSKKV